MRVLFSSTPSLGHVQPMLPLAVHLQGRGHEVAWATAADGCDRVGKAGIATVVTGLLAGERMLEYRRRWPESASLRGQALGDHMFPRLFGAVAAHAAFPALLATARRRRPDVLVSEAADFAAPVVAAALGIPQVTHGYGALIPTERVQAAAEETTDLWLEIGLPPRPFDGCYDHLYLDIYPPGLGARDVRHVPRRQHVRPGSLSALPGDEVPVDVASVLGGGRPVVYLTFGTVFRGGPALPAAVAGLARISDACTIVTVGPAGDPTSFGAQPAHVLVSRYVPQAVLFPRCSLVVSHAGSGTLLGAMAAAIPQVCLPQAADQFRNAAACAAAGAGVALLGEDVTPDAVEAAARRVLREDGYRAAARRLATEIAAMPTVADAADTVEQLASAGPSRRDSSLGGAAGG